MPKVLCKSHYGNSHLEMVVCKWKAPHTVDEYKHLGCQSDKFWCSQDSTWGPLDYEAKTLPFDQQVKYNLFTNIIVA